MLQRLRHKPLSYWLISAAILLATILAWPTIDARVDMSDAKNSLFMLLTRSVTNPATPHNVKIVWIGDDEFWGPELQHRLPTNRAYLAKLIRAADAADASVIALDFDLRLPQATPIHPGDYSAIEAPYRAETDALMHAIGEVAERRRIVLAKRIEGPVNGPFTLGVDAYQPYGICTALLPEGRWENPGTAEFPLTPAARANIACGYIALMDDKRQVPPPAPIVGTTARLDSLPLAIARARDPRLPERFVEGEYFASYIPEAAQRSPLIAVPASELLHDPAAARATLQGFPMIIGAAWHQRDRGSGEQADSHETPIGKVPGALIHANLAEAMLGNRTYPAVPHVAMLAIELVLGAGVAVLFALVRSALLTTALLLAAMPVLLGVQWLSLQVLGVFLDLFAPVVGLGLHAIVDRLIGGPEEE